ncbi:MAG: hypothetical protein ABR955_10965 [Verrucomicrobiota bacterium]|jgi:branched-chain amino acid transport system permease protein
MLQFIANGLCTGAGCALVATGFGLIYTATGIFHIVHGAIYTFAACALYCSFVLLIVPLFLSVGLALASVVLIGVPVEIVVYCPLDIKLAPVAVLLVSSLGVYIILANLIAMLLGNETKILRPDVESTLTFGNLILIRIQVAHLVVATLEPSFTSARGKVGRARLERVQWVCPIILL